MVDHTRCQGCGAYYRDPHREDCPELLVAIAKQEREAQARIDAHTDVVFKSVQAALLGSEGDPALELFEALEACAHFFHYELDLPEEDFIEAARKAWKGAGLRDETGRERRGGIGSR